jgi:hypothetical protein
MTTFSKTTLSIVTFRIRDLIVTLSIMTLTISIKCNYAEFHSFQGILKGEVSLYC